MDVEGSGPQQQLADFLQGQAWSQALGTDLATEPQPGNSRAWEIDFHQKPHKQLCTYESC